MKLQGNKKKCETAGQLNTPMKLQGNKNTMKLQGKKTLWNCRVINIPMILQGKKNPIKLQDNKHPCETVRQNTPVKL